MSNRDWIKEERAGDQPSEGQRIFEQRSTKIWVNGEELSPEDLQDQGLLEEVARQLGTTPEKLIDELRGSEMREISPEAAEAELAAAGSVRQVRCPSCERSVADRKGYCLYCGNPL
jgi:hypothetical protein